MTRKPLSKVDPFHSQHNRNISGAMGVMERDGIIRRVAPFPKDACFRCGDRGRLRASYRNPVKCYKCLCFGHRARGRRKTQDPELSRGRSIAVEMEDQEATPELQEEERPDMLKMFLPVSVEMTGISAYLD
ncbi:hypothetical protein COCNU_14G008300 [Cocos nucifera]|uniref:Uncharacterized protein n=1 Tax=Cocos nucifera TaxID=13894 RepID=A0A8K0IVC2_COCNU|nr:hypothetical protein COCNU_14G008300 [Cocos nucifera]